MNRASTASASRIAVCCDVNVARPPPPKCAISDSYGTTRPAWPRAASAADNWSACQPGLLRMTTCISSGLLRVQRSTQHLGIEPSAVERPAARYAGQPDLGRADEHRIDPIEVVVVTREDVE